MATEQWVEVMNALISGCDLPDRYRNHPLKGDKSGLWDCHIKPDLVLLYEKTDNVLILHRLGTHSDLF